MNQCQQETLETEQNEPDEKGKYSSQESTNEAHDLLEQDSEDKASQTGQNLQSYKELYQSVSEQIKSRVPQVDPEEH
jgi:hypothetical protein